MYSSEEVLEAALDYFGGRELSAKIWIDKYALTDTNGNILEKTPAETQRRLAREFARIEKNKFKNPLSEEEIYSYLEGYKKIIPQGSPQFGIGNPYQTVSLSNCFTLPIRGDSYGAICQYDEYIAQISKRRGGIGTDISILRPKGLSVNNSAKTTTGAISFMHRFSHTGEEVGQFGRRAAQMITISVHHPDILEFITIKNDETKVTKANISVKITKEFLDALDKNEDYELRWPVDNDVPLISKQISAHTVWNALVHNAWLRAEPGILFWDTILLESLPSCYKSFGFLDLSTNPCSELNLAAYDSCRLLLLLLVNFVKNPFTKNAYFDFVDFYHNAKIAQRLMDDLVDLEIEAIEKIIKKIEEDPEIDSVKATELELWQNIKDKAVKGRRTGTNITGLGDTIAAMNIKYDSQEGIDFTSKIYQILKFACYESSMEMSKELGPFPIFDHELEKDNPFLNRIKEEQICFGGLELSGKKLYDNIKKYGRRNIALLTQAPTGTISEISCFDSPVGKFFGTTGGIEPLFRLETFIRRKKINHNEKAIRVDFIDKLGDKWQNYEVDHAGVAIWKKISGENDINKSPYFGSTSDDINWANRVNLQAAAQKHIDHSISSTVNLPENVSENIVDTVFRTAAKMGCKGITVYRDKCRSGVLLSKENFTKREKELPCQVYHVTSKGQPYFVLLGMMNNKPYEIFAGKNGFLDKKIASGTIKKIKRGKYQLIHNDEVVIDSITDYDNDDEEALTRMTSANLRHGTPIQFVVQQLEKVDGDMHCLAKSMARALKKFVPENIKVTGDSCGGCNSENLVRSEGCIKCIDCGWSKC